jgi:hypothetical protein
VFALCSILWERRRLEVERTVRWDRCCGRVAEVSSTRSSACLSPFSVSFSLGDVTASCRRLGMGVPWRQNDPHAVVVPTTFSDPLSMSHDVDRPMDDVNMSSREAV